MYVEFTNGWKTLDFVKEIMVLHGGYVLIVPKDENIEPIKVHISEIEIIGTYE